MTSRLTNRGSVFGRSVATRLIVNHNRSVDVHTERGKVPFVFVIDKEHKNTHTHTQTDRHTDARDHNTFCVVYDSRKM